MTTTAHQTLASLRVRIGSDCPAEGPPPLVVEVNGMSAETWLLVGNPKGEASTYVLEREFRGVTP